MGNVDPDFNVLSAHEVALRRFSELFAPLDAEALQKWLEENVDDRPDEPDSEAD